MDETRVLSIRQPWAWCLAHGYKPIENRDWASRYRGTVMIHAGLKYDPAGEAYIRAHHPEVPLPPRQELQYGGIIGIATMTDCVIEHSSAWFFGKFGFVMSDARTTPFIPYKGALGLCRFKPLKLGA